MTVERSGQRRMRSKPIAFEIWLVAIGVALLFLFALVQKMLLDGEVSNYLYFLGVPLDDVYIHTRFAENLLHGFSYSFNPGQTLTADTSPLWVALIALCGIFTSHLELVALGISMFAYLAIGPGVYRASRDVFHLTEGHARIAGVVTAISSRLVWSGIGGMETALAALLALLVVEEHVRARERKCPRGREAIWLGLGILVRPEFMFFALVLITDWAIIGAREGSHWQGRTYIRTPLLLLAVIASPAFLLPLITRNSLLAHSSVVQGAQVSMVPNFHYLWFALRILASNNLILFAFLLVGLWLLRKDANFRLLYIIALGLPVLQAFVAPQFRHSGRYFFPIIPLLVIVGMVAWERSARWPRLIPVLIILAGLIETGRWSRIAAESVRNINDQHLAVVSWLKANMQSTDTLAVDDVGAIGYFLDKPVIDLTGLMTPSLWPLEHDQDTVWNKARAMGANLFVIYRRLNPAFFAEHKDSLVLQREFSVRLPIASAADTTMSIYRLNEAHGS